MRSFAAGDYSHVVFWVRLLVEPADDATDQIAVVQRPEIDRGAVRHRLQPGHHFGEPVLDIPAERLGRLDGDRGEPE